jgi:uncharacterized protein YjbJ (UPF0337 family)
MMNWNQIETGWKKSYATKASEQWSKLTPEQLEATQGRQQELSSSVQKAYGISKEESDRQISDWQSRQVEMPAQPAK